MNDIRSYLIAIATVAVAATALGFPVGKETKHNEPDTRPLVVPHRNIDRLLAEAPTAKPTGTRVPTEAAATPALTPVPIPAPEPVPEPIPPPPPAPTPAPVLTNDIERLVCSYGWDCYQALTVMWCESGGRPWADNGSVHGLFQIHEVHADRFAARGWSYWNDVYDPYRHVEIAYEIWSDHSWRAWGCRPW